MRMKVMAGLMVPLIAAVASPVVAAQEGVGDNEAVAQQETEYGRASAALDRGDYATAIALFEQLAAAGGSRADAATYWLAYAMYQSADGAGAIEWLRALRAQFPASEWLDDARYLEAEIRGATGLPSAEAQAENEMRLYALNALMHSAPDRARPALVEMLEGDAPIEMKRQALYVLMQADDDQSVDLLAEIAITATDQEMRVIALHSLAMVGGARASAVLDEVYRGTTDRELKRKVLEAWAIGSDDASDRLMNIARNDPDAEMRIGAIRALAMSGQAADLWDLYESESSPEVRRAVIEHMFMADDASRLLQVARSETDPELQVAAIRGLGMMGGSDKAGEEIRATLVQLYGSGDRAVRMAVLEAMAMSEDIAGLVRLFDEETDPEVRLHIVRAVSMSDSPEAIEFLARVIQR